MHRTIHWFFLKKKKKKSKKYPITHLVLHYYLLLFCFIFVFLCIGSFCACFLVGRIAQVVIGPAGTGKTTYCTVVHNYCSDAHRVAHIVNLDPAADQLPYTPSIGLQQNQKKHVIFFFSFTIFRNIRR